MPNDESAVPAAAAWRLMPTSCSAAVLVGVLCEYMELCCACFVYRLDIQRCQLTALRAVTAFWTPSQLLQRFGVQIYSEQRAGSVSAV